MSKAEADQSGLSHPVRGKNEQELLLILKQRVKAISKNGESFKDVSARSRHNLPPGEKQEVLLKAYRQAKAASSIRVTASRLPPIENIRGKPVLYRDAKTVLNMTSGFLHKLLCTGPVLNLGDACVFPLAFGLTRVETDLTVH